MNSDEQKKREAMSPGREGAGSSDVDTNKQGISNRPGDEDPDNGVDPEPGPPQVKDPNDRSK